MVQHACPVLFGIVSSPDHPIITRFGVTAADARIHDTTWLQGNRDDFGKDPNGVVLGQRGGRISQGQGRGPNTNGAGLLPGGGAFVKPRTALKMAERSMPLAAAQAFFHKEGVSSVATVKLKLKEDKAAFKRAVDEKFPNSSRPGK